MAVLGSSLLCLSLLVAVWYGVVMRLNTALRASMAILDVPLCSSVWGAGRGLAVIGVGADSLSGWSVKGVPAMGGRSDGGGVRANSLSGPEVVAVVSLSLLEGFFAFLLLVWVLGAIFALMERGVGG